jgi:hypothetical protein
MKVLDLRCANGHGFEGWFASEDDFLDQNGSGRIECPLCGDRVMTRLLSAPRLNISGARAPEAAADVAPATPAVTTTTAVVTSQGMPAEVQGAWLRAVRHVIANTEDVGTQFAEEARRIHYGEAKDRAIRGAATPEEREALLEEGIEVMQLALPRALEGPLQ